MNKLVMSALAAATLAATLPALAQKAPDATATKAPAAPAVAIPKGTFYRGLGPTQYLARVRLIGQPVVDKNGAEVGKIEDVILGSKDDKIDGVILGVGGFLGVNEKKVGVRISALTFASKDGKSVISMPVATKEMLTAVESYDGSRTLLQKASDAAKKAGEAVKDTAKKAGDAAKNMTK